MRAYVLGAAMLLVLTAPTLAEEFYVVQNPTTKKCTIVTEKPTTTTTTVVGGTTYTTRTEAQNALRTTKVCTTTKSTTTTTTSDDDEDEREYAEPDAGDAERDDDPRVEPRELAAIQRSLDRTLPHRPVADEDDAAEDEQDSGPPTISRSFFVRDHPARKAPPMPFRRDRSSHAR